MTDAAALRRAALRRLAVAREEARIAHACVSMLDPALGGAACHLQQAAEKAIKGLLILSPTSFRYVHDLGGLAAQAFLRPGPCSKGLRS